MLIKKMILMLVAKHKKELCDESGKILNYCVFRPKLNKFPLRCGLCISLGKRELFLMIAEAESNKNLPLKMEFLMTSIFIISGVKFMDEGRNLI